MNRSATLLAVLAVGAALLVAGCGDDDETTAATTEAGATGVSGATLTKEEFITQGDEICAAGDEEIEAAAAQFGDQPPQGPELVDFTEQVVVPSIQAQLDGVAALPAPEGEEEAVDELLSELQAALDELEQNPESLAEGEAFESVNQLAADFGFTSCGGDDGQ